MPSRYIFSDLKKQTEVLEDQYKAFLKFNNNSQLAFFSDKKSMHSFLTKFYEFNISLLNISEKEKKESKQRLSKDGFFRHSNVHDVQFDGFEDVASMIFFNPKSGIEIIFGFNELIPDKKNQDYRKDSEVGEFFTFNDFR